MFEFDWRTACLDAEDRYMKEKRQREDLDQVVSELIDAVQIYGPNPNHHLTVLGRHRKEWPLLWEKIDSLINFYK